MVKLMQMMIGAGTQFKISTKRSKKKKRNLINKNLNLFFVKRFAYFKIS